MLSKTDEDTVLWCALGTSVRGASHTRNGLPNQDAIGWRTEEGGEPPIVMAIADGHGNAKSGRSASGASFAVTAALETVHAFLATASEEDAESIKRLAQEHLAGNLVRHWQQAVENDLQERPLSAAELEAVEIRQGAKARQAVENAPLISYGTTILAVGITRSFILFLQLGDGDILVVAHEGSVDRPVPHDPRLFANETTSLCSTTAAQDFRVGLRTLSLPPALILASTDGYVNSFQDEAAFDKAGPDILKLLRCEGLEAVTTGLDQWLLETSEMGSGDDVTVGVLCRSDILAGQTAGRAKGME